jgi:ubiquinone/menaquinone biosynthesis C-methylase UbiE
MNPWLKIPLSDYENHMKQIGQAQMINDVFKKFYVRHRPQKILYLGASGGNGLEHVKNDAAEITAVDINKGYLRELKQRFRRFSNLNLVLQRIEELNYSEADLIFAPLIFEYVDLHKVLNQIPEWLNDTGRLVTILQVDHPIQRNVTKSDYPSVALLEPIIKLVDESLFSSILFKAGLRLISMEHRQMSDSKLFHISCHAKFSS